MMAERSAGADPGATDASSQRTGVLLVNLGTPDAPTQAAVRSYLRELLSDRRVVDLTRVLWLPILYLFILPFRPRVVSRNYAKIWTPEGSPLMAISKRQAQALQDLLSAGNAPGMAEMPAPGPASRGHAPVPVRAGMVCGNPSILSALRELRDAQCSRVVVLPLYPQYSSPTVGSAGDRIEQAHATDATLPPTELIRGYHDHPLYIDALAAAVRDYWETNGKGKHLLMSFHGMPQRFVDQGDPYAQESKRTARLFADALQLADDDWSMSYQSRFGREPWLQPYTDETLRAWGSQGRSGVDVICPGFAADCLETLEEIAMQNRGFFESAGGSDYRYIPALNDSPQHIHMMAELVRPLLQQQN